MVLVQEDPNGEEHVIYYLRKSLSGPELRYSHVEKLALEAVIVVQRFLHYILLCTTMVIADSNPMYHILTRQVLGGKYSKWIVILQEFDLEFAKSKAKKSLVFAELICDLPHADEDTEPRDSLPDELCSSSTRSILGMEISSFIFKPNVFSLISPVKNVVVFVTILDATLSSVTLYIIMVSTLSYDVV
jgi:hypothetical protein